MNILIRSLYIYFTDDRVLWIKYILYHIYSSTHHLNVPSPLGGVPYRVNQQENGLLPLSCMN